MNKEIKNKNEQILKRQLEIAKASVVSPEAFIALATAEIIRPCETFGCNCFILTPRGLGIVISELDRLAEEETSVN